MIWMTPALAWTPTQLQQQLDAAGAHTRMSTLHPAIDADTLAKVADGKVVTGLHTAKAEFAKVIWGVGVLDVPIASIYAAVNDDRNKPAYSKLSHVIMLQGQYCGAKRTAFQYLPVPLVTDRWWVVHQTQNTGMLASSGGSVREVVWTMDHNPTPLLNAEAQKIVADGGMMAAENKGGWWMTSLDADHTLMQFWALSDPGGAVPAGLAASFAGKSILNTFEQMETLARKGPSCALQ